MKYSRIFAVLSVPTALALLALPAQAGVLTGSIMSADGKPMQGVLVRLTDNRIGLSESVYSNVNGAYVLVTDLQGQLDLRLRTPYFKDTTSTIEMGANSVVEQDLVMSPMTDAREISESLPAAYHFGSLPFETAADADFNRLQFQRDCLSCHQIGNPFSRQPRTPESWAATIQRMHLYLGNFDMELRDSRSVILSEGFNGQPLAVRPQFPLDDSMSDMKLYEYPLDRAVVPHDAIYNPNDGLMYTVDQALDHIAITDPATGETEYVTETGGAAMSFRAGITAENPVIGEFDPGASHGPHSLDMGLDGKYYVTNTGTRSIGVFNPQTREWEAAHLIAAETGANYPHTIRVDAKGIVWFTFAGSEHVGRLDPVSGEFTILDLPLHAPMGIAGTTQPYGIDINPVDGSVWYGRLFADKVGRIDSETLEISEYDSPVSGPRRMHFDKSGVLWVAGYSEGMLARIEPEGFQTKVYPMPEFAAGFRPAPYALGVHPDSQDIWLNENMTDRLYRFIPEEERFIVYPVPLSGTYTRDMTFTTEGRVCTSNNPIPAPSLEGGVLQILCIDPYYDPQQAAGVAVSKN